MPESAKHVRLQLERQCGICFCMTATLPVCVRVIAMSSHFIVVISVTHSNYHTPFLRAVVDGVHCILV